MNNFPFAWFLFLVYLTCLSKMRASVGAVAQVAIVDIKTALISPSPVTEETPLPPNIRAPIAPKERSPPIRIQPRSPEVLEDPTTVWLADILEQANVAVAEILAGMS